MLTSSLHQTGSRPISWLQANNRRHNDHKPTLPSARLREDEHEQVKPEEEPASVYDKAKKVVLLCIFLSLGQPCRRLSLFHSDDCALGVLRILTDCLPKHRIVEWVVRRLHTVRIVHVATLLLIDHSRRGGGKEAVTW